jgi:hypothetical protein
VIRKEARSFYRTISGVRLCWELEEPKGPNTLLRGVAPALTQCHTLQALGIFVVQANTNTMLAHLAHTRTHPYTLTYSHTFSRCTHTLTHSLSVQALDIFVVQANTNTMLAHLAALTMSLYAGSRLPPKK